MASPGRFPELTVQGRPVEMGRQIGEHFRSMIRKLTDLALERANKNLEKTVSWDAAIGTAQNSLAITVKHFPDSLMELKGTAEGAGVSLERLMVLNVRNMLSEQPDGCTSIIVSAGASGSQHGFAGQNWDNDPAMRTLSAVITRRSSGKATFTTWTQPGLIAYMGFNSIGTGVCMNALNGPTDVTGVPWYFFVREILESKSSLAAHQRIRSAPRSITANAAMITENGPVNLEFTPQSVMEIGPDDRGTLIHTNHCLHPALANNNDRYQGRIYGQSFDRRNRSRSLLSQHAKEHRKLKLGDLKTILSDHDGYPTSICRHPNDHPANGWQRSVVSIILEPGKKRMHVSNGNPCNNPYETYLMG